MSVTRVSLKTQTQAVNVILQEQTNNKNACCQVSLLSVSISANSWSPFASPTSLTNISALQANVVVTGTQCYIVGRQKQTSMLSHRKATCVRSVSCLFGKVILRLKLAKCYVAQQPTPISTGYPANCFNLPRRTATSNNWTNQM